MPEYKTIPVDEETYQLLVELCQAYERKQGAQVKVLVKTEHAKLAAVKLRPKTRARNKNMSVTKMPKGDRDGS